jgi:hypothetical protein
MRSLKAHRQISTGIMFLLIASLSFSGWCQQIVKPWRSSTEIVKAGDTFEIWFNANSGQNVNDIELIGPYNKVIPTFTVLNQTWIYDQWSESTCNQKITVTVPVNTPADRYGLVLKTSQGDVTSLASVKIIKEYKKKFYVLHISDVHRWQTRNPEGNFSIPEISAVIDVANIIDPEMVIETGDNHYPNNSGVSDDSPKSTKNRIIDYMNGTSEYKGMNDFHAAVYTIPGNHDTPNKSYYLESGYDANNLSGPWIKTITKDYWNKNYGIQTHNFKYGNTRFMGINNSWCPDGGSGHAPNNTPNYLWQINDAISWLDDSNVGAGKLRVSFYHVPQEGVPQFYNRLKDHNSDYTSRLVLAGHIHRTSTNPYTYGEAKIFTVETARDGQKLSPFNLYQIDDETGTWTPVGNSRAAHEAIESKRDYDAQKIKMNYSKLNNGGSNNNSVSIINKFTFNIEDARVRFVMPKGDDYVVNIGSITQQFDGDDYRIVDVKVDLYANSISIVNIFPVSGTYNAATFLSQSVPDLLQGETAAVSVTVKNTGTTTWTSGDYFLGSQNPQDNNNWGITRVPLGNGEIILPNEEKTFSFNVNVPDEDGTFYFQWQMLQKNLEWFGTRSDSKAYVFGDASEFLDDCDSKIDWNPGLLSLTTTNKVQGTGALEFVGSDTDEYKKVFFPAYDAHGTKAGTVLQFWYYVSDPSQLLSSNQVEISSSGGPDVNEYNWSLSNSLSLGWNFIELNTKDAGKIGNPDLSAINWFRLYRVKSGSVTTRIDAIQLIGENGLSIDEFDNRKSFNIYPNPADTELFVDFTLSKSLTASLSLINILGQTVSQPINEQNLSPGNHKLEISIENLNSGIYFVSVKMDDRVFTKKIVIE